MSRTIRTDSAGLFANRVDESIYILFRPDPEGLGLQGGLALEFPPALLLKVKTQGLSHQLTLGSVFLLRRALRLSDQRGGKRDRPSKIPPWPGHFKVYIDQALY